MAYFTGLMPQQMGTYTGGGLRSGVIPNSPSVGQPVGVGPTANTPMGGSNIQPGMVQAPNAVLQNINNYAGSTGTLMGNANVDQGLRNYQAASMQYGNGVGQWNPWATTEQSAGGYGGHNVGNLFGNGANPGNIQAGNNYSMSNGNVYSQANYRNPYTGDVVGYGSNVSHSGPQGLGQVLDDAASKAGVFFKPGQIDMSRMSAQDLQSILAGQKSRLGSFNAKPYIDSSVGGFLSGIGNSQFNTGLSQDQLTSYAQKQAQDQYNAWLNHYYQNPALSGYNNTLGTIAR